MRSTSKTRQADGTSVSRGLDIAEEAIDRCHKVETLAQLLAAVGEPGCSHSIDAEVAARAGWMISEQAQELHRLLNALQKRLVK